MNRITNLDKTIKELTNRLDEVHPYSNSFVNHQNRNDGINYWKDKKIISIKDWNELYQKSSTYTNNYKTVLTSRKPLQYFPDDYNGSISISNIVDEKLKEEIQNWNEDYYELLEYRKNPTLGRMKCSKCLLSGSNDDPIFNGIEKVFARIVTKLCNNNNDIVNDYPSPNITYHCNIMNIFSCPFKSKEESKLPYKREDLFVLQRISFAIEQAISTFFELTKDNEIIYEVDFKNDRVHEIYTKYNGEPESWGWHKNVNEKLSKVKPISNIIIRDVQDIYNILTNREKLETLIDEYEKKNSYRLANEEELLQICYDEKSPCVPTSLSNDNSNNEKIAPTTTITELLASTTKIEQQIQNEEVDYTHKGENSHSKNTRGEESDNEKLILKLKAQMKDELEKNIREQIILLKENKQMIIDFLMYNKDSIKVEDLKIYGPVYKCYREKGNCHVCNNLSNIICINCRNNSYHNNKEVCFV